MRTLILILTIILTTASCNKIDEWTQFNVDYETNVVIESSFPIHTPMNIYTPEVQTESESVFENNNTNKDLVEKAVLTKLNLSIVSPSGQNFNFLESIEIYISADGLAEKKIAWKDNVPINANTITCDVAPDDIKDYIKKDAFTLKVKTVTDELLTQDVEINVNTSFFIDAKILGI